MEGVVSLQFRVKHIVANSLGHSQNMIRRTGDGTHGRDALKQEDFLENDYKTNKPNGPNEGAHTLMKSTTSTKV